MRIEACVFLTRVYGLALVVHEFVIIRKAIMERKVVLSLLEEYLEAPEAWADNVMIEVNPDGSAARLNDDEDVDLDNSPLDYWPVMDLLRMSVVNPGEWEIDRDAVEELLSAY